MLRRLAVSGQRDLSMWSRSTIRRVLWAHSNTDTYTDEYPNEYSNTNQHSYADKHSDTHQHPHTDCYSHLRCKWA